MDDEATRPVKLTSFASPLRVLVWGASGGIGAAFVAALQHHPQVAEVMAAARSAPAPWQFTLDDEESIAAVAAAAARGGPLDLVLVATGMLHETSAEGRQLKPEKSWRSLESAALTRAFAVNSLGPALIAKHCLGLLRSDAKAAFAVLSARVGSIEDNRLGGWYSYRASKAALNMLIRCFAIELRQRNPRAICVGLHPGTVDSRLSKPFQATVDPRKLFTPEQSVRAMLATLERLSPADSGRLWAYDGGAIPF